MALVDHRETTPVTDASSHVPPVGLDIPTMPVLLHYDHETFRRRLSALAVATNMYDGELPLAFESVHEVTPHDTNTTSTDRDIKDESTHHQINQAFTRIQHTGGRRVVVEAGHVYAYEDLGDSSLARELALQAQAAHMLTKRLVEAEFDVTQVMFFDDYNPDPATGEHTVNTTSDEVRAFLGEHGFDPAGVISEGAMVGLSHSMIRVMDDQQQKVKAQMAESTDGAEADQEVESLNLAYRGYELYRPMDDKVSCAMLDAALSMVKLHYLGDVVVNILPRHGSAQEMSYRSQQRKMRIILGEHLGMRMLPIINIFTDPERGQLSIAAGAHHDFKKQR